MKKYFIGGGGIILSLLAGCTFTPYTTNFECPMEQGVPCTRLSKINRMVDRGELGGDEEDTQKSLSCKGACSIKFLSRENHITYFYKKEEDVTQQRPIENSSIPIEEIKERTEEDEPSIGEPEEGPEL